MEKLTTGTTSEVTKIHILEVKCICGHRRGQHAMYETGFGREIFHRECCFCKCEEMKSWTPKTGWVSDRVGA